MNQKVLKVIYGVTIFIVLVILVGTTAYFILLKKYNEKNNKTYAECVEKTKLPCIPYYYGDWGPTKWMPSPYKTKGECEAASGGSICIIPGGKFKDDRWIQASILSASSTPTPKDETASWKTYANSRFGFELTFTDAWKGYRTFSSEGSQGVGAPTYLEFSLLTTDKSRSVINVTDYVYGYAAPLTITIIAKDRSYQGTGVKITQDNDNAYYYTINNDLPNDLQQINFEILKIISTFKFTK